jgi:formate-dependent phosphoribosylglycinamide formyltransferase (GAR transformylase)
MSEYYYCHTDKDYYTIEKTLGNDNVIAVRVGSHGQGKTTIKSQELTKLPVGHPVERNGVAIEKVSTILNVADRLATSLRTAQINDRAKTQYEKLIKYCTELGELLNV